jgi:diguanylate cyclase (GGDEF)-like protein
LPSIDPLTGLLSPRLFRDRVQAAVRRYARSRHNAVILYSRLANYTRIHDVHGSAAAEQSMIRAAMKLQRLMPDADCIGRVGESTMGLIFETVTARAAIMERASRLVAHGLMPLPGLKPEVTLNLHVAANVLAENPLEARQLKAAMESVLNSMSPRTRRPIRFLEPGAAGLAAVDGDPDRDEEGPPDALSA